VFPPRYGLNPYISRTRIQSLKGQLSTRERNLRKTNALGLKYIYHYSVQFSFEIFYVPVNVQRVTPSETIVRWLLLLSDFNKIRSGSTEVE
jgi:hypothetical protein